MGRWVHFNNEGLGLESQVDCCVCSYGFWTECESDFDIGLGYVDARATTPAFGKDSGISLRRTESGKPPKKNVVHLRRERNGVKMSTMLQTCYCENREHCNAIFITMYSKIFQRLTNRMLKISKRHLPATIWNQIKVN